MAKKMGIQKVETVQQPALKQHDSKPLDLAIAMYCTGSMSSYINSAKNNIRKIVEEIVASEKCDVRLALVEYRDHPSQDHSFVTRPHDFTSSPNTMKYWLSECCAKGGGDEPEAVADALHDILKLSWREEATQICICISDAPPHGLGGCSDEFPNGCPAEIDPMEVTYQIAEKGITIYMVGCEPRIKPFKDVFLAVAYITGGKYVPLGKSDLLAEVVICGAQEGKSLEQLSNEVETEVQKLTMAGEDLDESALKDMMHTRCVTRGEVTKQLRRNKAELPTATTTPLAKEMSKMTNIREVKTKFVPRDNEVAEMYEEDAYDCVSTELTDAQSSRAVTKGLARSRGKEKK